MAPRSILKVKDAPAGSILSTVTTSKSDRDRELAVHHATLIQDQKYAQNEVFKSMMILIDLPSGESAVPERPTQLDANSLMDNLKLFTPGDFDELVQERHANGRCGYALCPRPFKAQPTATRFRILGRDRDARIVSKESLESWCSEDCARRAIYLKVQLSDEPPWLRIEGPALRIMPERQHELPLRPKYLSSDGQDTSLDDRMQRLRVERDESETSSRPKQVMHQSVQERGGTLPATDPEPSLGASDVVEGYRPTKRSQKSTPKDHGEDSEGD